jgi:NAD(P)-dependent dehydrogenase (short-subunit alcohol dehydrogenase family)
LGAKVSVVAGDLSEKEYCEAVIKTCVEQFGGIDILLNNAGIIPRGTIEETTDDMWFSAMNVNLNAVFFLCRAAIPHMKKSGGAIVNTSSVWGTYPGPNHVAYCTSKGAVAALTKNLGRDCAPLGIRVNAVCPHEINTPMLRTGFERRGLDPNKAVAELNKTVPIGRIAEPEDIADVIAFLASDQARYIAGECVEVTGAKPVSG